MLLKDFQVWIEEAKTYWNNKIEALNQNLINPSEPFDNYVSLQQEAMLLLDAFELKFEEYLLDEKRLSAFKSTILALYSYTTLKYSSTIPSCPVPDIIPNDDLKNFFMYWTEEIPSYETLFHLEGISNETGDAEIGIIMVPTGNGELIVNIEYDESILLFEGYIQDDIDSLSNFSDNAAEGVKDGMIVRIFDSDQVVFNEDFDVKGFILDELSLQEICSEFDWFIESITPSEPL